MKILHVAMRLDPAIGGSSVSTVSNIIAEGRVDLVRTVLFCSGPDDEARTQPVVDRLAASGAVVYRVPRFRRPRRASAQFGLSRTAFARLRELVPLADVVHVHGPWGATSAYSLVLARRHGVPTVLTPRESLTHHDVRTSQSAGRAVVKRLSMLLIGRLVDAIIYTSDVELTDSPVRGRVVTEILFHAVVDDDTVVWRPAAVSPFQTRPIRLGFLGRFDPKKNLGVLIDALTYDDALQLVLAGAGPPDIEDGLRAQARKSGVANRVEFLGYVSPADRERFFRDITVLALPSTFENFGMAAAEAMAHGVPVIVTSESGVAEVIREEGGGRIVAPESEAIARAASDLSRLATAPGFAARVQAVARDRFSYSSHAVAVASVYRTLLAHPR